MRIRGRRRCGPGVGRCRSSGTWRRSRGRHAAGLRWCPPAGRAVAPGGQRDGSPSGCAQLSCLTPPGLSRGPAGRERSRLASGTPRSAATDRRPATSSWPSRPSSRGELGLPTGLLDIATHATHAAPARGGVLLVTGGFATPVALYIGLITELACRGYAVVAFDHPHETFVGEQPGGSLIPNDLANNGVPGRGCSSNASACPYSRPARRYRSRARRHRGPRSNARACHSRGRRPLQQSVSGRVWSTRIVPGPNGASR